MYYMYIYIYVHVCMHVCMRIKLSRLVRAVGHNGWTAVGCTKEQTTAITAEGTEDMTSM